MNNRNSNKGMDRLITLNVIDQKIKESQAYAFQRLKLTDYVQQSHLCESAVLVFVEEGRAEILINQRRHRLDDHSFVFAMPRADVKLLSEEGCRVCLITYQMMLQESVTMHLSPSFFVTVMRQSVWVMDDETVRAARAFCVLFEYNFTQGIGAFSADMAASLFSLFVQMFYQKVKDQLPPDQETTTVLNRSLWWRFIELVGANYKQQHQVTFYAEQLCVSPKYLTQIVKRIAATTPKAIIDRRLAGESAYMLAKTDASIQEVSFRLGFPDQSYFGRFFKRAFGMSPLAFRLKPDLNVLSRIAPKLSNQ